jgi:dolichol-phosphate mannosyltransferase
MSVPELLVIVPVFNERESIHHVLGGWLQELDVSGCDYLILIIDDGSTDDTYAILREWQDKRPDRFILRSRENRGHGQTCLEGYKEAVARCIPYVLQIDSDGQSRPEFFIEFWRMRYKYDVIYGARIRRDGWQRVVASRLLRILLICLENVDCVDANVPYRLMRTEACREIINRIPEYISLANVALAVMLRRDSAISHGSVPIEFPTRFGGEPSVPISRFLIKALELFRQLKLLRKTI